MGKIIGIFLLIISVFLIAMVWRTAPDSNIITSSEPSEATAPQSNIRSDAWQYATPSAPAKSGSSGAVISQPPQSQATPLNQRVYISSASVSGYLRQYSKITLYSRLKEGETVDITGWKIKTNKSQAAIPQAVEIYDLSGYGTNSDIILKPNNYADFYSLSSPINKNFRVNKCSGYLTQTYDFSPVYFYSSCPYISSADIKHLSGQCQSYIQSLGSCLAPDPNSYNSFPGNDEGNACRTFLQTIGYTSCVLKHRNDADFFSNNWVVWLYGQINLDPQHDYLRLYDKEGDLISEYNY